MGRTIAMIGFIVGLVVVVYMEVAWANCNCLNGTVLEKDYAPAETSIGTGVSSGGSAVVTSSYHDEKYIIHVETDSGVVINGECSAKIYFTKKEGDSAQICTYTGYFTGLILNSEITK